jgi:hypothetical protein
MNVWSYIPRLTEEYIDTWSEGAERGQYIHRLCITEEYILIYSSVLYFSVISSVNRETLLYSSVMVVHLFPIVNG